MHRETKQIVAIKLMKNIFDDPYQARKVLRELTLLRKLSKIQENIFTSQLFDIILPDGVEETSRSIQEAKNGQKTGVNQ